MSAAGDHLSFTDFLDNIIVNLPPDQTPLVFSSCSNNGKTNQCEVNPIDHERRKKRIISNRESARRSRMRKQKHLEDVREQVTRYKMVNIKLMNRLRVVNHNGHIVEKQNQRLRLEKVVLEQKLYYLHRLLAVTELHQTLLPFAWPCNDMVTNVDDQKQHSIPYSHIIM